MLELPPLLSARKKAALCQYDVQMWVVAPITAIGMEKDNEGYLDIRVFKLLLNKLCQTGLGQTHELRIHMTLVGVIVEGNTQLLRQGQHHLAIRHTPKQSRGNLSHAVSCTALIALRTSLAFAAEVHFMLSFATTQALIGLKAIGLATTGEHLLNFRVVVVGVVTGIVLNKRRPSCSENTFKAKQLVFEAPEVHRRLSA